MLGDSEFPLAEEILVAALEERLEALADRKGDKDLNEWKYNEEKTLDWLLSKVKCLGDMLEEKGIDVTGGASSNIFTHTASTSASSVEYQGPEVWVGDCARVSWTGVGGQFGRET